jgi:hypothetical protein
MSERHYFTHAHNTKDGIGIKSTPGMDRLRGAYTYEN